MVKIITREETLVDIGCYCLMKIEKFEETKHFGELKKKKQ